MVADIGSAVMTDIMGFAGGDYAFAFLLILVLIVLCVFAFGVQYGLTIGAGFGMLITGFAFDIPLLYMLSFIIFAYFIYRIIIGFTGG
jgi:hypothetical protein